MELNLNFGDIPEDNYGPLAEGPTVMKIIEAYQNPPKEEGKFPTLQLVLSPNVPPSSPLEGKKVYTFLSFSPKNYPRRLMKEFFEAVFQVPLENFQGKTEDLIGRTVIVVLGTEPNRYQAKKGPKAGEWIDAIKNVVIQPGGYQPHVAPTTAGVKLQ